MMLSPVATPNAGAVTAIVVPVVALEFVPMFLTNAMTARASDAARLNRSASASVATARRAGFPGEWTVFAPEGCGRWVIRVIVSPLRIANANPSVLRAPIRHVGRRGDMVQLLHGVCAAMCKEKASGIPGSSWSDGAAAMHESCIG